MSDSTDWQLLARYLAGECSGIEKEKVEEWIRSDPANQKTLDGLKSIWRTPGVPLQPSNTKKLWEEVAEKAGISKARTALFPVLPGYKRMLKYAAVILLVISIPFLLKIVGPYFFPAKTRELNKIVVANGKKMELTLDDGTMVTLDAGSSFRCPSKFSGDSRRVILNGEGYFRVSPQQGKPFVVRANHAVISVKGTKFNVRAWPQEQKVNVAVVEGSVSLHRQDAAPTTAVLISKGQLSVLPEKGQPTQPRDVDITNHLGWINRDMVFDNVPLKEILDQLERWYDIRFIAGTDISMSDHLTVHIQDRPVEDILELIAALTAVEYRREGRIVYLTSREN